MKETMMKRLTAIALVFVMAFSMVPVTGVTEKAAKAAGDPVVTVEGGYDANKPVSKGMTKVITHDWYTMRIEVVDVATVFRSVAADGGIILKYTFQPKVNGRWKIDLDNSRFDGYSSISGDTFVDESGKELDESYTEVAGKTFTATPYYNFSNYGEGFQTVKSAEFSYYGEEDSDSFLKVSFEFTFPLSIGAITAASHIKEITANSIELNSANLVSIGRDIEGVGVQYRKSGTSDWKTHTGGGFKITGLTPNTNYQIRVWYNKTVKDSNGTGTLQSSPYSNVLTVKTGLSATPKPVIKSVKTSKAKVKTKKVDGYWYKDSLGVYRYSKPYSYKYTSFKVTVKIKKKIAGATGYWVNVGGGKNKFGSKTTFSYTAAVKGSKVGKKVSVKVAAFNHSDGTGMTSWSGAKSVKIKK